jgi:hypothetical protein
MTGCFGHSTAIGGQFDKTVVFLYGINQDQSSQKSPGSRAE